jgi:hypothetical protein
VKTRRVASRPHGAQRNAEGGPRECLRFVMGLLRSMLRLFSLVQRYDFHGLLVSSVLRTRTSRSDITAAVFISSMLFFVAGLFATLNPLKTSP